jgi:nucleotide-binding universal stress UspA family protein
MSSPVFIMPNAEQDDVVRVVRARIEELETSIGALQRQLDAARKFVAESTLPLAGKPVQECIRAVLRTNGPMRSADLVAEAVNLGAASSNRSPKGDVERSLDKLLKSGKTLRETKDGRIELVE